jgi:hypothetical protein
MKFEQVQICYQLEGMTHEKFNGVEDVPSSIIYSIYGNVI